MNRLYKTFEFTTILDKVAGYTRTSIGRAKVLQLTHINEIILIREHLAKLDEAIRIIIRYQDCPLENIDDLTLPLEKTKKDGVLTIIELYRIANLIQATQEVRNFVGSIPFKDIPYFIEMTDELLLFPTLRKELLRCITPTLELHDLASPALAKIRREMKQKEQAVRSQLDHIVKNNADLLTDALITFRNDRLVIPVKVQYKYTLGGIVHDISDSGQTAFVEPGSVIELNAAYYRLKQEEKEEIERILKELSQIVKANADDLLNNLDLLTTIDFIFAKAKYAIATNAQIAEVSEESEIILHKARHPLLDPKIVVANDFVLSGKQKMILVTGPNTGGKTVALKTVGLLVLMNQAGLAIPVDGKAKLGVFSEIFADIGDEQSIENSLSTFSSHMVRIIDVVENVTPSSLVILDEIGGGTDPKEGEALAMAVLEYLHQQQCCTMVTTHYSNLKSFAIDSGYILNASMKFDVENLKPAYQLQLGIPGRSYALEISKRLGLPSFIIQKASNYKEKYSLESERLLEKMEKELHRVQQKESLLEEKEANLRMEQQQLAAQKEQLENDKQKLHDQADEEINQMVEVALQQIDEIVTNLKEKESNALKMHEWIQAKKGVTDLRRIDHSETVSKTEFAIGDYVFIESLHKVGVISSKKKQEYLVNVDAISLWVKGSTLTPAERPAAAPVINKSSQGSTSLKHVPVECNIIGKRVEEGLEIVDKYLDDALMVHLPSVRIIHGHGSGALRSAVHTYLKSKSFVKEFRLGGQGEGGSGATVVTLQN